MIIEQNDRRNLVIADESSDRKIYFYKHSYLPQYEANVVLGSGGGNASGKQFVKNAFAYVFNETDCVSIVGWVRKADNAARAFSNSMGWEVLSENADAYWVRCPIGKFIRDEKASIDFTKAERKRPK